MARVKTAILRLVVRTKQQQRLSYYTLVTLQIGSEGM